MGEKQKLQKEMKKNCGGFDPIETPANLRADLSIQERKEFEGKIKLEISSLTQVTIEFFKTWRLFDRGYLKHLYQVQEVGVTKWHMDILKLGNQYEEAV